MLSQRRRLAPRSAGRHHGVRPVRTTPVRRPPVRTQPVPSIDGGESGRSGLAVVPVVADHPAPLRRRSPMGDAGTNCLLPPINVSRLTVHPSSFVAMSLPSSASSAQAIPWHPKRSTYRCFLSDLTGFVGLRRTGPRLQCRLASVVPTANTLGREFNPAKADCGYRAPLTPRLARSDPLYFCASSRVNRRSPHVPVF